MSSINERNEEHESSTYKVPSQFHSLLGDKITGNNITTKISRLSAKDNLSSEEVTALNWLKGKDNAEVNKIDAKKRIVMDTEGIGSKKGGNAFRDTYTEDGISDPSGIDGEAKLTVSGKRSRVTDQIKNNNVQYYESYDKEMENMKYLIEYMNNNKPKII